jgi:hypothetical protein
MPLLEIPTFSPPPTFSLRPTRLHKYLSQQIPLSLSSSLNTGIPALFSVSLFSLDFSSDLSLEGEEIHFSSSSPSLLFLFLFLQLFASSLSLSLTHTHTTLSKAKHTYHCFPKPS